MGGASQKPTLSLVLRQLARLIQDISVSPSTRFLDRLHRLRLRHIIVTLFNLIPLSPSLPARQWQEITARAICSLHFDVPVNSVHPPIRELKVLHFTTTKKIILCHLRAPASATRSSGEINKKREPTFVCTHEPFQFVSNLSDANVSLMQKKRIGGVVTAPLVSNTQHFVPL